MPNNLWLLVGHTGVHVLNRRSKVRARARSSTSRSGYMAHHVPMPFLIVSEFLRQTALLSFPYKSIVNYSPSQKNIMIMTESLTRGTKYVFNTSEASQIAHLIKEYTEAILAARKREGKPVKGKGGAAAGGAGGPPPPTAAKPGAKK